MRRSTRSPSPALALVLLAALVAGGCRTVGPDYVRPELVTPAVYPAAAADPASSLLLADGWWQLFGDPQLDRLVALALEQNADLRIAAARVDEAAAFAGIARADRLPTVTGAASAGRFQVSEQTTALPPGVSAELERYRVTADLSYELDLWGRIRRQAEAAEAELLATAYGADAVRLAVVAGVVRGYFELLALDRQLAIAHETLVSRRESLDLQELRFDAGVISALELQQARAELAATAAAVPDLEEAIAVTENRLAVLLGRPPGAPDRGRELAAMAPPPAVPAGLPSELLGRRPDLAAAEAELVAANARIGVARAAYFPSLSLTADLGAESTELADLLDSASSIWSVAASLLAPIFDGGRIARGVDVAEARQVQALESYRQAVQTAFAEVEIALVRRRTAAARVTALAEQVAALEEALRLAGLRYEAGSSSYIEVLDAQRNLFRAELDLVAARRQELTAAVGLFEAMGGGWELPQPGAPVTAAATTTP